MYDILAWDENKIAKINCLIVSYLGNVFDLKIMTKKKKPLKSSKKKIFFSIYLFSVCVDDPKKLNYNSVSS